MDPADPVASARLQLKPVSEIKGDSKTGSNIFTNFARQLLDYYLLLLAIYPIFATKVSPISLAIFAILANQSFFLSSLPYSL